jgi:hypothetical protein
MPSISQKNCSTEKKSHSSLAVLPPAKAPNSQSCLGSRAAPPGLAGAKTDQEFTGGSPRAICLPMSRAPGSRPLATRPVRRSPGAHRVPPDSRSLAVGSGQIPDLRPLTAAPRAPLVVACPSYWWWLTPRACCLRPPIPLIAANCCLLERTEGSMLKVRCICSENCP